MNETPTEVLKASNVKKTYGPSLLKEGTIALTDASIALERGECCGLVGPNGAGKSTFIKIVTGIEESDWGTLHIIDDVKVGYVPERVTFYESMSAFDNLLYYAKLTGHPNPHELVDELLKDFGLYSRKDDQVNGYSKGMRQRLAIARSIVRSPGLLILDEPFSGLDPSMTMDLKERLISMKGRGITMLISSHNLAEVQAICDSVAFMKEGVIVLKTSTKRRVGDNIVRVRISNEFIPSIEIQQRIVANVSGQYLDIKAARSEVSEIISRLVSDGARIEGMETMEDDIESLYRSIIEGGENARE